MTIRVSLILATVGRVDDVGRMVQSLLAQTCTDFELIVVDQNSDDRLAPFVAMARQGGLPVVHLRQAKPNLSAARNRGLAEASGAVVGFPDDDCWYEPTVVAEVVAALDARPGCDGIVALWVEQAQARTGAPASPHLSLERWRRFRDGDASSISLFFKAATLRRVGGFDERFGVGQWFGAGEETDLILALLGQGAHLTRVPAVRVHHRHDPTPTSSARFGPLMRRARGTGALYVKHRLPLTVVLRGLLAPLPKAVWPWRSVHAAGLGLAVCLGRLHGALAWLFKRRTYP